MISQLLVLGFLVHAQGVNQKQDANRVQTQDMNQAPVTNQAQTQRPIFVRDISMFRSQVVLNIYQNKDVKVGSKILAQPPTSAHHKCLMVVTRVNGDTAYADATQCPGFATLKKGQQVQIAMSNEINEEIRFEKPKPEKSAALKSLPAPVIPTPAPVVTTTATAGEPTGSATQAAPVTQEVPATTENTH